MSKFGPFTNAYVSLNSTDLSNRVESLTVTWAKDVVDITAMGDGGHNSAVGLENNKFTVNFWQDYAASEVDATLKAIFQGGTAVAFKLGANGSTFSSTNPSWSGSCLCISYPPLGGKITDPLATSAEFVVNGTITPGTA